MSKVILLFLFVFSFGIKSWSNSHEAQPFHNIQIEDLAKDFKVPRKIFDQIETDVRTAVATLRPVYLFAPLQVVLYSKGNHVIKKSPLKISFPNGGGKIDLKDYLDLAGTFSLSFPKEQFEKMPALEALYFVSDAKQMEIENEIFGLGCGKMVNLKNQFELLQKIDFLKLNTTAQRYIYVTTGFFIFVFRNGHQVHVTHLHVTDSRYPDHLCSSLYTK